MLDMPSNQTYSNQTKPNQIIFFGSSISSIEKNINIHPQKPMAATDKLSII